MRRTLTFDIETHSADLLYSMKPHEFVRLIGYSWDDGDVVLTTDLEDLKHQIRQARWIIGHNIHSFDLVAVFGKDSNEPMQFADQGRVYDTWTHAALVHPAPETYINRFGKGAVAKSPEQMKGWFGLDEQAYQLGVVGKTHNLRELVAEYGPDTPVYSYTDPSTGVRVESKWALDKVGAGFGLIPVDEPRYREYLKGDVRASSAVAKALLKLGPLDAYAMREQRVESRKAAIRSNGFRVDIAAATKRRDDLRVRRDEIMVDLQARYGLPTEGDAPWATDPGKTAILAALADYGITPSTVEWPKTPGADKRALRIAESRDKARKLEEKIAGWQTELESGTLPDRSVKSRERWIERDRARVIELLENPLPVAFGLSLSGDTLIALTENTAAAELGAALAELKGQRSMSQLTLDTVHPDGFVHPEITMLQRSARWSTTEPGLTVWSPDEKFYYLPDIPDHVLIGLDYSNADARIVAAYSGDRRYAERFKEGADGHLINALAAWGESVVNTDPGLYRQKAKAPGHGWNYSIGPEKAGYALGAKTKAEAKQIGGAFVDGMNRAFKGVVAWKKSTVTEATRHGYVLSEWGRKLWVEKGREFTQAPALKGQNGTREIVCDALLAMPHHVVRTVKAQIHDEVIFSVPRKNWEECRDYLANIMEASFEPKYGGQRIEFPVSSGPAGENWQEATHAA